MTETLLLDANLLIALSYPDHIHHGLSTKWFAELNPKFATCPITQGALARFTMRIVPNGAMPAKQFLEGLAAMPGHEFWTDDVDYRNLPWKQIFGYRQLTDAYLVTLAKNRGGRLATLDKALATVFPDSILVKQLSE
jgi:toxin-antitoxin system PIN domain toxin